MLGRCSRVVALISGGGSGLGRACAERMVAQGGRVIVADLNKQLGSELVQALGKSAVFCECDVTSTEMVTAALDAAESHFGEPINAAVNCAGTLHAGKTLNKKLEPHSLEHFERVLKVNVLGSFNVLRLSAQRMASRPLDAATGERGVVVNTASIAAFDGQAGQAAYSASKGAIVGMTLPIARDLASAGVRVCTVAPGIFDTPMMAAAPDHLRESLAAQVPFPPRFGAPDEFAQLVESIVLNPYLNGEVIRLDGAVRMGK